MSVPSRSFDAESGLAFTEVECPKPRIPLDWAWPSKLALKALDPRRSINDGVGARSLRETALRATCFHSAALTAESFAPEDLSSVPTTIAKAIWSKSKRHRVDCLGLWTMLAQTYAHNPDVGTWLEHRAEGFQGLTTEASALECLQRIAPTVTPNTKWIMCLTLHNVACPRTGLLSLSDLHNLAILTIWSEPHGLASSTAEKVDERIIRAWSDAAFEAGAFSKLKLLACIYQDPVRHGVFESLAKFPVLQKFCCSPLTHGYQEEQKEAAAMNHGWESLGGLPLWTASFGGTIWLQDLGVTASAGESLPREHKHALPLLQLTMQGQACNRRAVVKCFQRAADRESARKRRKVPTPPSSTGMRRKVKSSKMSHVDVSFSDFGV